MLSAQEIDSGKHFCSLYRNKREQLSVVIPFLVFGLLKNEKCVYVYDETNPDEICDLLKESGIAVSKCVQEKQLVFLTKEETYLAGGVFSPDRMIENVQETYSQAIKSGFSGLRGSGEAAWILKDNPGTGKIIEYESRINNLIPKNKFIALCQYNESRFIDAKANDILLGAVRTHPELIVYGRHYDNPYYVEYDLLKDRIEEEYFDTAYSRIRDDIINPNPAS